MDWCGSACSKGNKIRAWVAVIRAKVVDGLESAQLTKGMLDRLQAFQLRGRRRILRMSTTYVDRRNTNARVFARATAALCAGRAGASHRKYLADRAQRLLAHVIRAPAGDPVRRVTFAGEGVVRISTKERGLGDRGTIGWRPSCKSSWDEAGVPA